MRQVAVVLFSRCITSHRYLRAYNYTSFTHPGACPPPAAHTTAGSYPPLLGLAPVCRIARHPPGGSVGPTAVVGRTPLAPLSGV